MEPGNPLAQGQSHCHRAKVLGAIGCHSFRKLFCVRIYAASGKDIMKTASAMGHRQIFDPAIPRFHCPR